jgi:hypothetical protein
MDPLITNGIDPALLQVLEKRGQERDPATRRKRPAVPRKAEEEVVVEEEDDQNLLLDPPKHMLDDLA